MKWGKIMKIGLVVMLFAMVVLLGVASAVAQGSVLGREIPGSGGFREFLTPKGPAAWVIGGKDLIGNPTVIDRLVIESNSPWSIRVKFPEGFTQGLTHWALFVDRGKVEAYHSGTFDWVTADQGRVVGFGFAPGQEAYFNFDPQGANQVVWWGADPDGSAQYGPDGQPLRERNYIPWLGNRVPGTNDWFYLVSTHCKMEHPGESCAYSIEVNRDSIQFEPGKFVPLPYCARWYLQKGHPFNFISGYLKFTVRAGPQEYYDVSRQSLALPGYFAPGLALWVHGDTSTHVTVTFAATKQESDITTGSSEGVAIEPGDPEVTVEVIVGRIGGEAWLEWGPNDGHDGWPARFGPSGTGIPGHGLGLPIVGK